MTQMNLPFEFQQDPTPTTDLNPFQGMPESLPPSKAKTKARLRWSRTALGWLLVCDDAQLDKLIPAMELVCGPDGYQIKIGDGSVLLPSTTTREMAMQIGVESLVSFAIERVDRYTTLYEAVKLTLDEGVVASVTSVTHLGPPNTDVR